MYLSTASTCVKCVRILKKAPVSVKRVDKETPMFFCKPADAVVSDGADVPYPSATTDLHHEVEMVVAIGNGGRDLTPEQATALVWGWT